MGMKSFGAIRMEFVFFFGSRADPLFLDGGANLDRKIFHFKEVSILKWATHQGENHMILILIFKKVKNPERII